MKKTKWFLVSDAYIVLYDEMQLPQIESYRKFKQIAQVGNNIVVLAAGKLAGREDKICNVIMNKSLSVGIRTHEILMTWSKRK